MTTDAPRPRSAWRAWLTALFSTLYLVAFVTLARDLPAGTGSDDGAVATIPDAPRRAPASVLAPPRVADLARARDARPPAAPRLVAEPRVAPSRARPTRRPSRRIRTRSS